MSEHHPQKKQPTKLSVAFNRGCLVIFMVVLVITLIGVIGLVVVFLGR